MSDSCVKKLDSLYLFELEKFATRIKKFRVNFAACDSDDRLLLLCEEGGFKSSDESLKQAARKAFGKKENTQTVSAGRDRQYITALLESHSADVAIAVLIDLGSESGNGEKRNKILCELLAEMLEIFVENFRAKVESQRQIEVLSTELAEVYEELMLLHKLSANMKITERDTNFLQMACDSLTEIVSVEGIAILLDKTIGDEKEPVLVAGKGLIDINEELTAILYDRLIVEINNGREGLLDSEVDSSFKYNWPENIKNLIAVPLYGKGKTESAFSNENAIIGLMVSINRVNKPDFNAPDMKLFNSVANDCAVFIENRRLFEEIKELFIGSLKSLAGAIDAKDQYTRGHSERVAFIARWIAERITDEEGLDEEAVNRIYLAGLLHDVGKLGVDDAVLRKTGKLTKEEFDIIKTHPSIGAGILSEIKQMRDIVPGVLFHHERVDGKGYPNGLSDDCIPLIGKIVGLADSFDAMTSQRTYRNAMTVAQAIEEIENELGAQFDEKVGRVFLNSDINNLWNIMQGAVGSIYGSQNFTEYGTTAIGTLVK